MISEQENQQINSQIRQSFIYVRPPIDPPNIIANEEDMELISQAASLPLPDSDNDDIDGLNNLPSDSSKFKDITA